jgi:hypothetical protein
MTWIVGIDEAGYGPNLGPLVMTAVSCRVPDETEPPDLWALLADAVRRAEEPDDDRLPVGDSKLVYSTARGLKDLEASVLAILAREDGGWPCVAALLETLAGSSLTGLASEPWYTGTSGLPSEAEAERCQEAAERFRACCATRQVEWGHFRSIVICPTQFNQLLEHWDSKGAVLGHALVELLSGHPEMDGFGEPVWFFVDKHGGRNNYAAMLQSAIADGMVVAFEEGRDRSIYRILGLKREVRLTFQPRADAEHFCVSLASMVSKYVREMLMKEFNQFWQTHLPELKPTAGYPGDAVRYYDAIRPIAQRLGLAEDAVWRKR